MESFVLSKIRLMLNGLLPLFLLVLSCLRSLVLVSFPSVDKKIVNCYVDVQVGRNSRHLISFFFRLLHPYYWPVSFWNFLITLFAAMYNKVYAVLHCVWEWFMGPTQPPHRHDWIGRCYGSFFMSFLVYFFLLLHFLAQVYLGGLYFVISFQFAPFSTHPICL